MKKRNYLLLCIFSVIIYSCKPTESITENQNLLFNLTKLISFDANTYEVNELKVVESFAKFLCSINYNSVEVVVYNSGGIFDAEVASFMALKLERVLVRNGLDQKKIKSITDYDNSKSFLPSSRYRKVVVKIRI